MCVCSVSECYSYSTVAELELAEVTKGQSGVSFFIFSGAR